MKRSSDSSVFAIVILTIVYLLLQIHYEQSSVRQYGLLTNRKKNSESSGCPIWLPHSKTPKHKHITPEQVPAQPAKQHTNNFCSGIVLLIK